MAGRLTAVLLCILSALAVMRSKNPYDAFLRGAGQGMALMVKTAPGIFAAALCAGMLETSGFFAFLTSLAAPAFAYLRLPGELLPMFLIRPVSGSAALAVAERIIANCGPDSFAAQSACVMMGSTETVLYTIAVYTAGSALPRRILHRVLFTCLAVCMLGGLFSAWICALMPGLL